MAGQKQIININKKKFKWNLDIGIVIFGMVILYLAANFVVYLSTPHIAAYEIREGSIITDTAYTGFAVRSEKVFYSSSGGYVSYLVNEGEKAAVGDFIYSVSKEEPADSVAALPSSVSSGKRKELTAKTQKFNIAYDPANFASVYDFSYECKSSLLDYMSTSGSTGGFVPAGAQAAENDGILAFTIDGYEDITPDSFTVSCLDRSSYTKKDVRAQKKIKKGEPVYKLIRDDAWYLYIELSDKTAAELKDASSLTVLFKKDNESVTGKLSVSKIDGKNIACLEFSNSVVRYANDRYLDVELLFDHQSGLKIPRSAVVEKEFYSVPDSYISKDKKTNSYGVYVKEEEGGKTSFCPVDIYYSANGYSYVPMSALQEDAVLSNPDTKDTFRVGKTKKLKGVYNINKGYAVFRLIYILNGNDTYYIVKEGTDYGLYNYDQIVLYGSKVKEDDIVFQ